MSDNDYYIHMTAHEYNHYSQGGTGLRSLLDRYSKPKQEDTDIVSPDTDKDITASAADCTKDNTCPMYPFDDLDMSAWYHDGIHYCIENGLMNGTGTTTFAPDAATSRAMIVTILWRLEGEPVVNYAMIFEDVAADTWYTTLSAGLQARAL